MTMRELVAAARSAGQLAPEEEAWISPALIDQPEKCGTPWYLQALVAVGAWVAAGLLIAFASAFFGQAIWDKPVATFAAGLVLIAAATGLQRAHLGVFFSQAALAVSVAGHVLAFFAAGREADGLEGIVCCALVLAAVLYALHDSPLHRFLSTGTALLLSTLWVQLKLVTFFGGTPSPESVHMGQLCLYVSALLHVVALALLFLPPRSRPALRPLGYAMALSLLVLLLPVIIPFSAKAGIAVWPLRTILAASLLGAIFWAAGGFEGMRRHAMAFGAIFLAVIVLGLTTNAAILAALAMLVVGFALQDRALLLFGAISLPGFVFCYYYSLQLTLREKSWLLLATGAVLLMLRAVLVRLPWGKEGSATT